MSEVAPPRATKELCKFESTNNSGLYVRKKLRHKICRAYVVTNFWSNYGPDVKVVTLFN